jgi:hypothetical protein
VGHQAEWTEGRTPVGFETMPQIADLEIAATWDEIELEAALRGRSAEAQAEPSAETSSCLSEALRAVEELKGLPKEERKRRAEELLRALTSALPAEPVRAQEISEPLPTEDPPSAEPVLASMDRAAELPIVEPVRASPEISLQPAAELPSAEPVLASLDSAAELPSAEPVPASLEISLQPAAELSSTEPIGAAGVPDAPQTSEPAAAGLVQELPAAPAPPTEAPVVESAAEIAASAPVAEPTPEAAPELATVQTAATQTDSIPKFLATECASLEAEQPDSLIPFRTTLAACALVAAVVLIYFWSSQEFGLAARTIAGTSGVSESRVLAPEIPPSVAVRQAFVAAPPAYSAASEPVRVYRPPFVGFDFLDESGAPPAAAKTELEPEPAPSQAALVVPQSSAEETAALPPSPSSDLAALIKRGDALLKAGDIAAARSAYERAAAGGNAKAQIGVAKTYDPLVLAKLKTRGVRGDPVQAASWYARASEAGDEEGRQRLQALIAGLSDCMLSQGACAPRKP